MDFINEQNGVGFVFERLQHTLEALLEITPVLGARQQRAHVQRIHLSFGQDFGHCALGNAPGQPLGNGRFTHTSLTHQQRVVFAAAAQDLDGPLDLVFATDQGVDLAVLGRLVEIVGVLLQRRGFFIALAALGALLAFIAGRVFGSFGSFRRVILANAVGDEIDHIQAGDALLMQVVHRVRVLFAKDGHQHVGTSHFLLAVAGGLHMHDGTLDHALEPQRRLRVHLFSTCHLGRVVLDEIGQRSTQIVNICRAGTQHLGRAGVVQQGQKQVLNGDEFMPLLTGLDKGHVQADFEFLSNHEVSFCALMFCVCKWGCLAFIQPVRSRIAAGARHGVPHP